MAFSQLIFEMQLHNTHIIQDIFLSMARKKAVAKEDAETVVKSENTFEGWHEGEESVTISETPANETTTSTDAITEPPALPIEFDAESELAFARIQIEYCEDFLGSRSGSLHGDLKRALERWRTYKVEVRICAKAIAEGKPFCIPIRPQLVC